MKYFIADTHFNHQSIIENCYRPFKTVKEMNDALIENWNNTVKKGDLVYHLGDFALPNKENGYDIDWIIKQLNGQIHLIRGNHDRNVRKFEHMFTKVTDLDYIKGDGVDKKYRIMLSHYPMRTWRSSCWGSWHLHGHSHGQLAPKGLMLDIGVDNTNFKPMSFENIKVIMLKYKNWDIKNEDFKTKGIRNI